MTYQKKPRVLVPDCTPESLCNYLPTLALVGRTNVGKSTLFNYLTNSQIALTGSLAGITRDRRYGLSATKSFLVVDTAGISNLNDPLDSLIEYQTQQALAKANAIGIVVDARVGLKEYDREITHYLRTLNKPIFLIINKAEKVAQHMEIQTEFATLGFKENHLISALEKMGVSKLIKAITNCLSPLAVTPPQLEDKKPLETPIKIALIGRPNAGKSTLMNHILGEQRSIVSDQSGTTRESIASDIIHQGKRYIFIDTAGIRRRSKIESKIEAASVDHSWQAAQASHVVLILIDATVGITDQDLRLLQLISELGKALIILINKSDAIVAEEKIILQKKLEHRLQFISFFKIHYISALEGKGLKQLFKLIEEAYNQATQKLNTSQLTRFLQKAIQKHQPPVTKNKTVKLRYAHPGGSNPPMIVIHGTQTRYITKGYQRYLENFYRDQLGLTSTPIHITFKEKTS